MIRLDNCYILEMSTSKRKAYWVYRLSTYYDKRSAFIEDLSFFGTPVWIKVHSFTGLELEKKCFKIFLKIKIIKKKIPG